jgi:hypothetical protein
MRSLLAASIVLVLSTFWAVIVPAVAWADVGNQTCAGNACVIFDPPAARPGQEVTIRNIQEGKPVGVLDRCTDPADLFFDRASGPVEGVQRGTPVRGTPTQAAFTVPNRRPGEYDVTVICPDPVRLGELVRQLKPRFIILGLPATSTAHTALASASADVSLVLATLASVWAAAFGLILATLAYRSKAGPSASADGMSQHPGDGPGA